MNQIESLYKEWQSLQPLNEQDQNRLDQKFMLEFNYNSNHIEGNTLTYGQTEMLLVFGKVVEEANMKDLEDMKASNVGLKIVKVEAEDKEKPLTESFIRELHRVLLREDYTVYRQQPDGTNTSYVVHAGSYKTRPNSVRTVTGEMFEYASPEETPALMTDLIQWYNQAEAESTFTPIELAALFHYRYIRIHPFEDGNGRVSRLIVNYILHRHGYPMIVVKSSDKNNYLTALNRCDIEVGAIPSDGACAELSQIAPFVEYMSKCLVRALEISIKCAKGERIEEDDDWKKRLKTKYQNQINRPEITDELKNKILNKDYMSLLQNIDNELSAFYSIFTATNWWPTKAGFYTLDLNEEYYASCIYFKKDFGGIISEFSIEIQLKTQQYLYKLNIVKARFGSNTLLYSKEYSYNEFISDQDKNDVVNAIGQYLEQFIESNGTLK